MLDRLFANLAASAPLSRRAFLKLSAGATGGLMLGAALQPELAHAQGADGVGPTLVAPLASAA